MLRIGNPPRNSSFEVVEVLFDIAFLSSCELNVLSYTDNFLKALVFLKDILSPSCLAYNEYMDIVYRLVINQGIKSVSQKPPKLYFIYEN